MEERKFTCGVCFDEFVQNSAILCSLPELIDLIPKDQQPSTSGFYIFIICLINLFIKLIFFR